jgi:tetratricopeptide (TPR) repeat protein
VSDQQAGPGWAQDLRRGETHLAAAYEPGADPGEAERAIACLTAAAGATGIAAEPRQRALESLAEAFGLRQFGDPAANAERAVGFLEQARALGPVAGPLRWIKLLLITGAMYTARRAGSRRDNLESAISALTEASGLLDSMPEVPAPIALTVHAELGNAYAARLAGDPAANRETALARHRAAVALAPPGSAEWQELTSAVTNDLLSRLGGDRAADLEEAIGLLRQLLGGLGARDARWATVKSQLGSAYRQRIAGDEADNIEQAIACYQDALTVISREDHRIFWAELQNNLGNAYAERLLGDGGDNLRNSAACLRSAADAFGRTAAQRWAGALSNLALTQQKLAGYDDPEAGRRAVEYLRQALSVGSALPPDMRAQLQAMLGQAMLVLAPDSPALASEAAGYLRAALEIFTPDGAPVRWSATMHDLGAVQLAAGDLAGAIGSLLAAGTVRTRELMPLAWADTQRALGDAYHRAGENELAAACLAPAAEIFRSAGDLRRWRAASIDLAETRADLGDWPGAATAYGAVLDAAEASYQRLVLPGSRQASLRLTGVEHAAAAYAAVRAGDAGLAARWLEGGRARILGDTLARDRADLTELRDRDADLAARFEAAVSGLRRLETEPAAQPDQGLRPDLIRAADEARRARYRTAADEYAAALAAVRVELDRPGFLSSDAGSEPLAESGSADEPLAYLAATRRGGIGVVLRGAGPPAQALELPALTTAELAVRLSRFLSASAVWSATASRAASGDPAGDPAGEAWRAETDDLTRWLWTAGLGDLAAAVTGARVLTLVPGGGLSLLPLHAAWQPDPSRPAGRRYLLDVVPVSYAPSARVLELCAPLAARPADRLLAIADPQPTSQPELRFAGLEAAVAAARLPGARTLTGAGATVGAAVAALAGVSVVHFACHARADLDDPEGSGFVLAGDEVLDVRRIRAQRTQLRLAILSACETAQPGGALPDEVIGLPAALLQAGAAGVLATWWPVPDDLALAIMLAFYERWDPASAATPPAVILADAQQWVRDASNADIRAHLTAMLDDPDTWVPAKVLESVWENVVLKDPDERPFESTSTWAAFGYYGW